MVPEAPDEAEEEGADVGAPLNETKLWARLAKLRLVKAGVFLQDKSFHWSAVVWTVLTAPVMNIHYALFKHATWLSDRDVEEPEAVEGDFDLDVSLTASCFCKAAENPAKKAMVCLSKMLRDVSSDEWGPAVLAFGPVLSWPQARLRLLRRGFFTVVGQLWRKLLFPWTQYPWKLACLIDREMSPLEKQRCAEDLFARPVCCLDGFARKL